MFVLSIGERFKGWIRPELPCHRKPFWISNDRLCPTKQCPHLFTGAKHLKPNCQRLKRHRECLASTKKCTFVFLKGICSWAAHQSPPSTKTKEPEKFNPSFDSVYLTYPDSDPLLFLRQIKILIEKTEKYNYQPPQKVSLATRHANGLNSMPYPIRLITNLLSSSTHPSIVLHFQPNP